MILTQVKFNAAGEHLNNAAAADIYNFLKEKPVLPRGGKVLYIVPTKRYARQLKKDILSNSLPSNTQNAETETIRTLALRLVSSLKNVKMPGSALGSLILRQSINDVELKYLSVYRKGLPAGIIRRIEALISDFKENGITPEALIKEAGEVKDAGKLKLLDIASIYKTYQENVRKMGLMEYGDLYHELNSLTDEEFQTLFNHLFGGVEYVVVKDFDYLTDPEAELLRKAASAEGPRMFVKFNYHSGNKHIFSHLEPAISRLRNRGFQEFNISQARDNNEDIVQSFRKHAAEKLFNNYREEKIKDFESVLHVMEAADREKEVLLIAGEIKRLIRENNVRPESICVAFNLIEKYSPVIRDTWETAGIPLNITDRKFLKDSLIVAQIMSLLEIAESSYSAVSMERFVRGGSLKLFSSGFTGFRSISRRLNDPQNYKEWLLSLKKAERQIDEIWEIPEENKRKVRDELRRAGRAVKQVRRLLRPFEKKMSHFEFTRNLTSLFNIVDLTAVMSSWSSGEIHALNTFIESVNEIFNQDHTASSSDEKHTLKYFLDQIRMVINQVRYAEAEKPGYGVMVTTLGEMRGLKFDYLFIGGMCDGDLPAGFNPAIILHGAEQLGREKHLLKERYHFLGALNSWEKALYLSSPLSDKRRDLVVSGFVTEFRYVFEVTEIKPDAFSKVVLSRRELLEKLGKNAGMNGSVTLHSEDKLPENLKKDILHAVEVTKRRRKARPGKADQYSGILNKSENPAEHSISARAAEALRKMEEENYSVTRLEIYQRCPFRFFLKKILKIEAAGPDTDEAEAFEIGTLLHSVLFEFYTEISGRGIILQNSDDETFSLALGILFGIAEREINSQKFIRPLSFFEKEKILGIRGKRENSILYRFLEIERKSDPEYRPMFFETAFENIEARNSASENVIASLKGKIDRIDVNEKERTFRVIDYKLGGKKPSEDDLYGGISLQLPVYMYAASLLLKEKFNEDYHPEGAYIYPLKTGAKDASGMLPAVKKKNGSVSGEDIMLNEKLIEIALASVKESIRNISSGNFSLSLLKDREVKACAWCEFKSICRVKEKI